MDEVSPKGTRRSQATVNRYLASFSGALTYDVKDCGWLSVNPMFRIKKFKESEGRDRVLSAEELPRLLNACQKSPNKLLYPFILLAIFTGARSGELLSLTWNQVNLDTGEIYLKETKNGEPRILVILNDLLEMVRAMFSSRNPERPEVFPSKTRFGKLTLRKPWEKALRDASIEGLRVHDLRHCFSTCASESGASNIQLQKATGHKSVSQLERYCHPDKGTVRQIAIAVYEKFFPQLDLGTFNVSSQSDYQSPKTAAQIC